MNGSLNAARIHVALVIALSLWVLHSFVPALLVACVIAVASRPLYRRFAGRLAPGVVRRSAPLAFTVLMSVFVLALARELWVQRARDLASPGVTGPAPLA